MESFRPLWFVTLAFEKTQLGVSKMVPFVSELSLFNPFCHRSYRRRGGGEQSKQPPYPRKVFSSMNFQEEPCATPYKCNIILCLDPTATPTPRFCNPNPLDFFCSFAKKCANTYSYFLLSQQLQTSSCTKNKLLFHSEMSYFNPVSIEKDVNWRYQYFF